MTDEEYFILKAMQPSIKLEEQRHYYLKLLEQKENIIKKVREYINEDIKGNYFKRYDDEVYKMCEELLEILDKGNK